MDRYRILPSGYIGRIINIDDAEEVADEINMDYGNAPLEMFEDDGATTMEIAGPEHAAEIIDEIVTSVKYSPFYIECSHDEISRNREEIERQIRGQMESATSKMVGTDSVGAPVDGTRYCMWLVWCDLKHINIDNELDRKSLYMKCRREISIGELVKYMML